LLVEIDEVIDARETERILKLARARTKLSKGADIKLLRERAG